jgi:hypothetical protein
MVYCEFGSFLRPDYTFDLAAVVLNGQPLQMTVIDTQVS